MIVLLPGGGIRVTSKSCPEKRILVDNHQGSFATNPFITDFVNKKILRESHLLNLSTVVMTSNAKKFYIMSQLIYLQQKIYLIAIMAVEDTREA